MIRLIDRLKCKIADDSHLIELLQGTSTAFIYRIIGLILGYVFTIIISRAYGAEAMGIYALSMVVLGVATLIGKLGTDTALVKLIAQLVSQNKRVEIWPLYKKVIMLTIPFSIVITLCVYLIAPFIANNIFHKGYLAEYFQLASLAVIPFVFLSINREAIRGLKSIKAYSILLNVAVVLIATILLSFLYFYSDDVGIPLIAQLSAIFMISGISYLVWLKKAYKHSDRQYSKSPIKYRDILSISFPMLVTASMAMIMGWTDIVMLGIYANESDVGVYNVALKVSMLTSIALMAINTIAAPKFAEFWGHSDIEGLSKIIQQSTKLIFWTSFPTLFILICFPGWVLNMFGREFIFGSSALIILALGQFINSASGSVGIIMNMTNNQKILQYSAIFSALINIVLNFILIPKYGVMGAAIATTISGIIWNIFCVIYIKKKLDISVWYIPLLRN